jgi:stearoyl-CoA desaturase (delta-9 desaturase)
MSLADTSISRVDLAPDRRSLGAQIVVFVAVIVPFLALIIGMYGAVRGNGITLLDFGLSVILYLVSGYGIGIGFHRLLTHRSFRATRSLRVALAIAGSLAIEGPVIRWVADHRRHHAFADRDGDPHSPWRYGNSVNGLLRGLWWAHMGWLFDRNQTSAERFAPDLLSDRDMRRIDRLFLVIALSGLLLPPGLALLVTGFEAQAAFQAFLWAGLIRVFLLHHVTWSVNSICHVAGSRPFVTREKDMAANFWPLAVLSFGESWHNLHHAMPSYARLGVDRWQVDPSAALIRLFELRGWATNVNWPNSARLAKKRR